MNKYKICIWMIIILTFCGCSQNTELNEIAAIVNGENIYQEEILNVLNDDKNLTYDVVLQNTIDDLLLIQYGIELGMEVSDQDVEERFSEVVSLSPMIEEKIEKFGIDKYKDILKNVITIEKVKKDYLSKYEKDLQVTDAEIDNWYRENINGEYLKSPSIREQVEQVIYDKKVDDSINRLIEELRNSATIKIIEVK